MSRVAEYMLEYADELSGKIEDLFEPLHRRGDRSMILPQGGRSPIGGQYDAMAALVKAMQAGEKTVNLIGELGSGKTTVATMAIHSHADGSPYRAIVMCPPHLTNKWCREIMAIVPDARPRIVERYRELIPLAKCRAKPRCAEFFVVSESMAKLGTPWEPSVVARKWRDRRGRPETTLHCSVCYDQPRKTNDDMEDGYEYMTVEDLAKVKKNCDRCHAPLWQWTHSIDRWPLATFIHKKMRGMFDYAVLDEMHLYAAENSACSIAMSKIVESVNHVLPLTGTYLNGYAHSIMHLLWRSSPATIQALGFDYGQTTEFVRRYGRLEKTVRSKITESNKTSQGNKGRTTVKVRPGIVPSLFGDHILNKSVFLSMSDVSDALPPITKSVVSVAMDPEQRSEYTKLEQAMAEAMSVAMERKDMSLLSRLVHCLIGYADRPYGWDSIGYTDDDDGGWVDLVSPGNLNRSTIRPKEKALLELIRSEAAQGRQVWVFVEMTHKRDIQPRIESLVERLGLKSRVLRSQAVPTKKREEWIEKNAVGVDVMIGHPRLTSVGLDLFQRDPRGGYRYNFSTLVWLQSSMSTSTTRQASGRSYRIGQSEPCKVITLHYGECMESRLVELLGEKVAASEAIDGRYSTDGLAALSGSSGEAMGLALAKSLIESMQQRRPSLKTAS